MDKFNGMFGGFTHPTYLPQRPAPQMKPLESGRDTGREIRQRGRERELQQSGTANTHKRWLVQPSCMTLEWDLRQFGLEDSWGVSKGQLIHPARVYDRVRERMPKIGGWLRQPLRECNSQSVKAMIKNGVYRVRR